MSEQPLPLAVFLMGPTASGKTDLAIALQDALPGRIISVDSAMIYRDMNIGTAKPDARELARAPHDLIDLVDPAERYSAADFCRDSRAAMARAVEGGRTPLLVGGTMMYYQALYQGLSDLPEGDPEVRARLETEAREQGLVALHQRLQKQDPEAAARIHPNNRQRLLRALEVYELTGRGISSHWQTDDGAIRWEAAGPTELPYRVVSLALAPASRERLHQRINQRFEVMLEQGLIDEVAALRDRGDLHRELPSMRCVGYRQVWDYLEGDVDHATMVARGQAATRQLAKRQLTWLRRWPGVIWLDSEAPDLTSQALAVIHDAAS